jgi:hypothetical protein
VGGIIESYWLEDRGNKRSRHFFNYLPTFLTKITRTMLGEG